MTKREIYKNLCWYDKRNPSYTGMDGASPCYCDECFYGRDELAREILRLLERIKKGGENNVK